MYTREDYVRDCYLREHASGVEKWDAEMRCIDFEHGRDPEARERKRNVGQVNTSENGNIAEKTCKGNWGISIIVSIIAAVISSRQFFQGSRTFVEVSIFTLIIMFLTFQLTKYLPQKNPKNVDSQIPKSKYLNLSYTSGQWSDDLMFIAADIDKYRILFGQKLVPVSRGSSYEYDGVRLVDELKKVFLLEMESGEMSFYRDYTVLKDLYTLYLRIINICKMHPRECILMPFPHYLPGLIPSNVPTYADCCCARGYLFAIGVECSSHDVGDLLNAACIEFHNALQFYPDYSPAKEALQILKRIKK